MPDHRENRNVWTGSFLLPTPRQTRNRNDIPDLPCNLQYPNRFNNRAAVRTLVPRLIQTAMLLRFGLVIRLGIESLPVLTRVGASRLPAYFRLVEPSSGTSVLFCVVWLKIMYSPGAVIASR